MEVLRKVYKDGEPVYHVKTDKGLVIRIKGSDDLTDSETEELLLLVSQDVDKMKNNRKTINISMLSPTSKSRGFNFNSI